MLKVIILKTESRLTKKRCRSGLKSNIIFRLQNIGAFPSGHRWPNLTIPVIGSNRLLCHIVLITPSLIGSTANFKWLKPQCRARSADTRAFVVTPLTLSNLLAIDRNRIIIIMADLENAWHRYGNE